MTVGSKDSGALEVAIVGGGIVGLAVAQGFLNRGIHVKIYERSSSFANIGAGIGLSPNAERSMLGLDKRIHAAFRRIATKNDEDWFPYVDGFNVSPHGDGEDELFKVYLGKRGTEGCRRTDFLEELAKLVPESNIEFQKELVDVVEGHNDEDKLVLKFGDGTTAEADVVLGCDGIRSRVRQLILGPDNPASYPSYSHKFAFRTLIPMEQARETLGRAKSSTRCMHLGHNAHIVTYPVAMGKFMNVAAFVTDQGEWPNEEKMTLPISKKDAAKYFDSFGPVVAACMNMLPDDLIKWGIYDLFDNPVTTYVSKGGRMCILGDAAHGSAPHHGAGAGFGIEDALVLAIAMEGAVGALKESSKATKSDVIRVALATYERVRLQRTRWLVESSRYLGELYEWQTECGSNGPKMLHEVERRGHKIWDYDIDGMVRVTKELLEHKFKELDFERKLQELNAEHKWQEWDGERALQALDGEDNLKELNAVDKLKQLNGEHEAVEVNGQSK